MLSTGMGDPTYPVELEGQLVPWLAPASQFSMEKAASRLPPPSTRKMFYTYLQGRAIMSNYSIMQTHYEYLEHRFSPSSQGV